MPRKRKTPSGLPAQSVPKSVPGVRYGEGVEHQQLADAMPAADMRAQPGQTQQPTMTSAPGGLEAVMQQLQNAPTGMLSQTSSPGEPVTAGLPTGPGPGPEAIKVGATPLARTMIKLSQATGDATFRDLALRMGLR